MKTLVILHGWGSSKEKWQSVKQAILKHYEDSPRSVRVVVPDLPGFKKETALKEIWDLDDYIKWLENFISENSKTSCPEDVRLRPSAELGRMPSVEALAEGFYLLGHSFGGRMAIKFAVKHSEKLKGLILVSAAGIQHKQNKLYLTFLAIARFVKWIFLRIPVLRNFFPFFRKIFYKYILRKTDYIEAEKLPYLKETFKNVVQEDLTKYLSEVKTNTLIIWGERDKITSLEDAYLMNEKIKNSKLEILKGVGHALHLEDPEVLTQKIMNFIKK
ncbi:MAG: alpha/beta hydrolase [Minisyncoccales bacterium]